MHQKEDDMNYIFSGLMLIIAIIALRFKTVFSKLEKQLNDNRENVEARISRIEISEKNSNDSKIFAKLVDCDDEKEYELKCLDFKTIDLFNDFKKGNSIGIKVKAYLFNFDEKKFLLTYGDYNKTFHVFSKVFDVIFLVTIIPSALFAISKKSFSKEASIYYI